MIHSTSRNPDVIAMPEATPIAIAAGNRIGHASVANATSPRPQPTVPRIKPNGAARCGPTRPTHNWAGTIAVIAITNTSPVVKTATDAIAGRSRIGNSPNVSDGSPKTPSAVGTMTFQNIGPDPAGMPRLGRIRRPGVATTVSGIDRDGRQAGDDQGDVDEVRRDERTGSPLAEHAADERPEPEPGVQQDPDQACGPHRVGRAQFLHPGAGDDEDDARHRPEQEATGEQQRHVVGAGHHHQ